MISSVNDRPFIIIDPRPMPDELMYSYLNRLAVSNFISSANLAENLMYDRNRAFVPETVSRISYGSVDYIGKLTHLLDVNPLDFFLDLSIYPGIAPLLIPTVQTRWINNVFRGNLAYPHLINGIKPEITILKYCPVCMTKELSDYGFSWLHRKHHMPGVTACDTHGVSLVSLPKKITGNGLTGFSPAAPSDAAETDISYAAFAHDFLDARISANWWGIRNVLLDEIDDSINNPENSVRSILKRNPRVDPEKILQALFIVFGKPDRIPCCENEKLKNDFQAVLDGYALESPYSETAVCMRKEDESNTFVTTPGGFIAGWQSPSDDIVGEEDKYRSLVRNMTAGAYFPDGPFYGMDKKSFFIHADCGTRFSAVPSYLLEGITACPCLKNNGADEAEIRRSVEESGHYELTGYSGQYKPLTITCFDCGHTFNVRWKTWKKQSGCRVCMREAAERNLLSYSVSKWISQTGADYNSRSVFEMRKQELVGDEFVIAGRYTDLLTPVNMLHRKCGNVFSIIPNHFLHGGRCPYCGYPHDKEFLRYIEIRSNGRYECVHRNRMLYTLRDNVTGKVVTLRKLMIMQEFERLTPSEILPLDVKDEYIFRKKNIELVSEFIAANYSLDKGFSAKDISIPGLTDGQIYESIKKLVRKGKLMKKDRIYMLVGKDLV